MKFTSCLALVSLLGTLSSGEKASYEPLYAGTQLAFYSTNAAPGYLAVQPYVFVIHNSGIYNKNWSSIEHNVFTGNALLLSLETGITKFLDFTLLLEENYNTCRHHHSVLYGDTKAYLGWQVSLDKKDTWVPDTRLLLGESFPTGKYQKLNPKKSGSDVSSSGSYDTSLILVIGKTFWAFPSHPFNLNLNLYYTFSTKTHVEGFNAYGGTFDTKGVVKPGDQVIVNLGIEASLNQCWALGTDIRYVHQNKSSFSGKKDTPIGHTAQGLPSSEQFSIAPCIEYSWNANLSTAFGAWVTFAGRNAPSFAGGVSNIYYYF